MTVTINGTTGITNDGGYTGDGVVFADTTPANTLVTDTSGNVGIGVAPSAWGSTAKALQLGGSTFPMISSSVSNMQLAVNGYFDNTNFRYITSGAASRYLQNAGAHSWHTAPSGTAGNVLTFTQSMTLDSSGNLGIGTTSPGALLDVSAAGTAIAKLTNRNSGATEVVLSLDAGGNGVSVRDSQIRGGNNGSNQTYLSFYTSNAAAPVERAQITSDGNLRIGISSGGAARIYTRGATSTSASFPFYADNAAGSACLYVRGDGALSTGTAALSPYSLTTGNAANLFVDASGFLYRSTSSLKYKADVQDAAHGLAELLQLRSVTYKSNRQDASGVSHDVVYGGLIAEEVHGAGLTEFVQYAEDGTPDALAYGNMVSLCVKAIQEQQAIILAQESALNALTARVAALEGK